MVDHIVPNGWRRTRRGDVMRAGMAFYSYQVSVNTYMLVSFDEHGYRVACVGRNYNRTTYSAFVGGVAIGRLYRSEGAALDAVVKAARK